MPRLGLLPSIDDIINETEGKADVSSYWGNWLKQLQGLVNNGELIGTPNEIVAANGIEFEPSIRTFLIRVISSTSGGCVITANPQIMKKAAAGMAGIDGQEIIIEGSDNVRSVTLSNGNGLQLAGGASITLKNGDVIRLHYNKSRNIWIENCRSINHT